MCCVKQYLKLADSLMDMTCQPSSTFYMFTSYTEHIKMEILVRPTTDKGSRALGQFYGVIFTLKKLYSTWV